MSNYIIITNIIADEPNFGKIKKIELTKTGIDMFSEIHDVIRKEYDNGFLMCAEHETVNNRKKYKIADVMVFKNGVRMTLGFEHSIQYNTIKWVATDIPELTDSECPHCGEIDDLEWAMTEAGNSETWQHCTCGICGCRWNNTYKFVGVQILN